ncbi:MAG TPA: hypothetical protein EYP41_16005 [Anaerolineae bacterium]|nr:hypothetical protein [Anaerolineae bacterium]
MEKVQTKNHREILQNVLDWPPHQQIDLAHELLKIAASKKRDSQRQELFEQAVGLLATDEPPPTDEEIARILEEERMKKYG